MVDSQPPKVSAEEPDSEITVRGTDHITIDGGNTDDVIEFYRDILGMRLVLKQPNLDRRHLDHLFFDTGDDRLLTFFTNPNGDTTDDDLEIGDGGVHHLAFEIDADKLSDVKQALQNNGYRASEADRGVFHSLYTTDPSGLTIELVANKWNLPEGAWGDVLATAQDKREQDGDEYVQEHHIEYALEKLSIDVERTSVS